MIQVFQLIMWDYYKFYTSLYYKVWKYFTSYQDKELHPYLRELVAAGKKIFLITNSPFETVDVGMNYMVGEDWRDLFEVCNKLYDYQT